MLVEDPLQPRPWKCGCCGSTKIMMVRSAQTLGGELFKRQRIFICRACLSVGTAMNWKATGDVAEDIKYIEKKWR